MALTKEDLQAIGTLMDSKLEPINNRLDGIDKHFDGIDGRFDVIDGRLDGIDGRLDGLQGDVAALKADMAHHNHMVEPQLKIIREGLGGWSERARQVERHENKLEDHGNRILALEYAFKTK